jgi:cobalt-zinc-cadmium efflux system protein
VAHSHSHAHDHSGSRSSNRKRLLWALALAASFMVAEVAGGLVANSLALLADAGHMLSDVGALGLSLFALCMAARPSGSGKTFGYHRIEILAALVNGATLVALAVWIVVEAVGRLEEPPEVRGPLLLIVAVGGLVVNLMALAVLHGGRDESLNVRGAWLHVMADAMGSVQAIAAGALIWAFGWHWVDPVASIVIAVLIVYSSWSLLQESVAVLMESAPGHVNVDEVRVAILGVEGVGEVHDLHVWTITSGFVALSAHVVTSGGAEAGEDGDLLPVLRDELRRRFGIEHVTIQVEEEPCGVPGSVC